MAPEEHRGYFHRGQILVEPCPLEAGTPHPPAASPVKLLENDEGGQGKKASMLAPEASGGVLPVRRRIWRSCLDFEPLTLTCHHVQRLATP